jgi:large subunit ribosomal protein L23
VRVCETSDKGDDDDGRAEEELNKSNQASVLLFFVQQAQPKAKRVAGSKYPKYNKFSLHNLHFSPSVFLLPSPKFQRLLRCIVLPTATKYILIDFLVSSSSPQPVTMSFMLRRTLASLAGPSSTASTSIPSIASTLPQAVRRRRLENPPHPASSPSPLSDPSLRTPTGKAPKRLPPQLEAEFQALRAQGQFKGDETSGRRAFLNGQVSWRNRVRGVKASKTKHLREASASGLASEVETPEELVEAEAEAELEDGEVVVTDGEVIGQRIYLPNIQIRLMRNHTPPGDAYDPNVATFRIPQSMTKTDLRGYLSAVYDLPVTFIRTGNYIAPLARQPGGGQVRRKAGSVKTYKRAVVGLSEPFHYPDDIDELYAQGRAMGLGDALGKQREEWLEDNFMVERMKTYRKSALMKFYKGYRWRSKTHDNEVSGWIGANRFVSWS